MNPATSGPDLLIFAISSAIKLGHRFRDAYVQNVQSAAIVLPLPNFSTRPNHKVATEFFDTDPAGVQALAAQPAISRLHDLHKNDFPSAAQTAEYVSCYQAVFAAAYNLDSEIDLTAMGHLLRLRQWSKGEGPKTSPLQLVCGSLLEVAVDYIGQTNGAFYQNSPFAGTLHQFFTAIDQVDFTSSGIKEPFFRQVVPHLLTATMEVSTRLTAEATNDTQWQLLLKAAGRGVATDLTARVGQLATEGEQASARQLGGVVLKSMLRHGGQGLLAERARLITTDQQAGQLVQAVGSSVLELLLTEQPLANLFTHQALDQVVGAAMSVIAENPAMLSQKPFLQDIIRSLAGTVAQTGLSHKGLLPELTVMVLTKTSGHLPQLLIGPEGKPQQHLLVVALQHFLQSVGTTEEGRLAWSGPQLMGLCETLTDTVIQSPEWVTALLPDGKPVLKEVLDCCLTAWQAVPKGQRLRVGTFEKLLQVGMKAVLLNDRLLDKVKTEGKTAALLEHTLTALMKQVFESDAASARIHAQLAGHQLAEIVLDWFLSSLTISPADLEHLNELVTLVGNELKALRNNEGLPAGSILFASLQTFLQS